MKPFIAKTDDGELRCHNLKTHPKYFQAVSNEDITKRKTVEIRKNDRDFRVGDYLNLLEWDPKTQNYTGERVWRRVTHILDEQPWMPEGYVALSIFADEPIIIF